MKSVSEIIAMYYRNNQLLPSDTIDCMEYTLKALINELTKVLMYVVVFAFFGVLSNFLLAYVAFVTVRLFAGGIHCKTYWGCALVSFLMLGSCVGVGVVAPEQQQTIFVVSLISIVVPVLLAPVTPSFRVIKTDKHKMLLRAVAAIVSLIWVMSAHLMIKNAVLSVTVLFTVSLANYQLIIPKIVELIKRGGEEK